MTFQLTEDQQKADLILDAWIKDSYEPFLPVVGVSGSGKSTLIVNKLKQQNLKHVVLTAPTNEALEVLAETIPQYSAKTIYSLLGFRPTATSQEEQIIVRSGAYKIGEHWQDPPPVEIPYLYVILDEAFYTPNQLIEHIYRYYTHIKWIFMGDPAQLKALTDTDSKLLNIVKDCKYKIELLKDVRSICPEQKTRMVKARDLKRGLNLEDDLQSKIEIIREIIRYFDSCDADPRKGGDPMNFDFLALAYHHRVVNKIGKDLREWLFGHSKDLEYQPGEIIRVSEVVDRGNMQIVRTNERVRVLNYNYDQVLIERLSGEQAWLPIDFENKIEKLYEEAKEACDAKIWGRFHQTKRQFVRISSPIALTAHSAQGRTAKKCLVDIQDILKAQNDGLFYVSLGRSRELAWLIEGW